MNGFVKSSLILSALIVAVQGVIFKDCGSISGKFSAVSVTGCEKTPVCSLKHNRNYTISVTFTPNKVVKTATAVVHGKLGPIPVPFPIANPDGCHDSGLKCPVKPNTQQVYSSSIFVKALYPRVKVFVKWELKDQDGKDLFCVLLPAQIVDTPAKDTVLRFKPHHA